MTETNEEELLFGIPGRTPALQAGVTIYRAKRGATRLSQLCFSVRLRSLRSSV